MLALVLPNLEDRHDPRMVQVGGRLGLGSETLDVGVVRKLAGQNHFEGDGAVQTHLPCPEHDTHSAAGDLANNLVITEITDVRRRYRFSRHPIGRAEIDGGVVSVRHCVDPLGQIDVRLAEIVARLLAHVRSSGDWDIAFVIREFGGPKRIVALLSHTAVSSYILFPADSTVEYAGFDR